MTEPPKKKRRLPALDDSIAADASKTSEDDPAHHQGRVRTKPHVKGQWAAHVYLELRLDSALRKTLSEAVALATMPGVHSEYSVPKESPSLHVSLSRPLLLQSSQLDDFKAAVKHIASKHNRFAVSFASFCSLENDEHTRRFLCIEASLGWSEMKAITDDIDGELKKRRLATYYDEPRFHASIAWSTTTSSSQEGHTLGDKSATRTQEDSKGLPFDDATLQRLEDAVGRRLRKERLEASQVMLKIGKDSFSFPVQ